MRFQIPDFFYIIQARVAGNARKFIQIFSSSDTIEFITMLTRIRPITHCACIDLHFSHWASFADKRLNLGKFYTKAEPTFTQIYMCTFPVSLNRAKIINILLHAEYARRRMLVTTRGCVKFLITTVSKTDLSGLNGGKRSFQKSQAWAHLCRAPPKVSFLQFSTTYKNFLLLKSGKITTSDTFQPDKMQETHIARNLGR
jgi:hypothetical protein